jgi:hemoglobin
MTSLPDQSADRPTSSLYDELGGEPTVTEAVDRFYRRVLDDADLAEAFVGVDVDRLKAHQVDLFTKVLGGPDTYGGRSLAVAHQGLGITDAQYDKVGEHLIAVLVDLGAGDRAVSAVGSTLTAIRPDIIEHAQG